MQYAFQYYGGVRKITAHASEKFLIFFVLNGKEVPLFQMQKEGLIKLDRDDMGNDFYMTNCRYLKLFVCQNGFNIEKRYFSFYIELKQKGELVPMVQVKPFDITSKYFFKSKLHFMRKAEVLPILGENESAKYLKRQKMLPVTILKMMITKDATEIRKGLRKIRIGRG